MKFEDFKPGDWVESVYGAIGIVENHECDTSDDYIHGRYVYGTANVKAGSLWHCRKGFCTKVERGKKQDPQCMDPFYWAMMV